MASLQRFIIVKCGGGWTHNELMKTGAVIISLFLYWYGQLGWTPALGGLFVYVCVYPCVYPCVRGHVAILFGA